VGPKNRASSVIRARSTTNCAVRKTGPGSQLASRIIEAPYAVITRATITATLARNEAWGAVVQTSAPAISVTRATSRRPLKSHVSRVRWSGNEVRPVRGDAGTRGIYQRVRARGTRFR